MLFAASSGSAASAGPSTEVAGLTGLVSVGPLRGRITLDSTNTVSLKGLEMEISRAFPIDATVVLSAVLTAAGAVVTGTQNIPMAYVGGTGRKTLYRGVIPHSVPFIAGQCTVRVTATDATGDVRVFNRVLPAMAG